jgi:cytosine/adenosine deaminase-related metal-dependent hydrolase
MDPVVGDLEQGDVLVEGTTISEIGASLDVQADDVIDATGMIVMPGMIDTHSHLWHAPLRGASAGFWGFQEYLDFFVFPIRPRGRAVDVYAGTYVGAREFIANGVTTAVDFCHPLMTKDTADAAVRGLKQSGLRAIWAYSSSGSQGPDERFDELFAYAPRLLEEHFGDPDSLVSMGIALTGHITAQASEENRREVEFARSHGLQMVTHSNSVNHVQSFYDMGLLGSDIIFAHANLVSDVELDLMAKTGAVLSTSMQVEQSLGYSVTALSRAVAAGVRTTNSIDSLTMVNPDLLGEARATYNVTRAQDGQRERDEGRLPLYRREHMPFLTSRDVLALITSEAARALGMWDSIGSLAPGKQADIVLLSTGPFGRGVGDAAVHVVTQAHAGNVDTVLIAGTVHKRGGLPVGSDPEGVYELNMAARDHYLEGLRSTLPSIARPGGTAVLGDRATFER